MESNILQEYLENIRQLNGLQNAILSKITLDKKRNSAEFTIITDKAHTKIEEIEAKKICQKYVDDFSVTVDIIKRVPDEDILKKNIYNYMEKRFPAASAFLKEEDIEINMLSSGANFYFDVASGEQSLFNSSDILDSVSNYLKTIFCGSFYGNVRIVEKEREEVSLDVEYDESDEEILSVRTFPIEKFSKIDGADTIPKVATYIDDCRNLNEEYVVCGFISFIQERECKKEKEDGSIREFSVFSLTVNDGSGFMRMSYFPKKATIDKVRELKSGDPIVVIGVNESYNGYVSFKAKKINHGRPPEGFQPEARQGKPVPKNYKTIFPETYTSFYQSGLFDDNRLPDDLKNNQFVVFDLETTGLNNQPSLGKMDRIIEIGAVKIINGTISEKFSTFVACPDRLEAKIIELTGIHDEDLVGAPEVEDVLPDFYKFCDGCFIVGHNVQFDCKFVKYYCEQIQYMFDHKQYDTYLMSQEQLLDAGLSNYKLNTIADYFGIKFNHHRAFDDALTTAKIFIELMKMRKTLPR